MQTITINATTQYDIIVGNGLLDSCGEIISDISKSKKAVIVTDDNVGNLYAERTIKSLNKSGISTELFVFQNGEKSKSHEVLIRLYEFLTEKQITRSDLLIALGGGVVGDLTGFAAATYLRGMEVVQIPTTLLAQTDSSIGGKTAVNISNGKNLVGAFKQPLCVICDIDTFSTLPNEIFSDGMSEIIKYGMIRSRSLFDILTENCIDKHIEKVIVECINIKKSVVEADEFDKGERMLLNFGHTFGHALEKHYNFDGISHGRAVAIGMCIMSQATEKAGLSKVGTTDSLISCLKKNGLDTETDIPVKALIKNCLNDKKRESDKINLIVCKDIGESEILKLSIPDFFNLMEAENV